MSIEEVGTGLMPNVYIDKIELFELPMGQGVGIRPSLSVKEMRYWIDLHTQGGVWENTLIQQHGKINLLILASYYGTSQTSQHANNMIESINNGSVSPVNINTDNYSNIVVEEKSLLETVGWSIYKDKAEDWMYSISYDFSLSVFNLENLQNLVLYATTYIDLTELPPSYDFAQLQRYVGYTSSEYVYKDGQKVTSAYYFIDKNTGKIWPGPVHQSSDGEWMAGPRHTEESHPVLTQVFLSTNPKIIEL